MFSRIKHLFQLRLALPTILLLVGLFLFLSCIFDWFGLESTNKEVFKLIEKIGDLILISSIISFLIDSAEYLGIFKRENDKIKKIDLPVRKKRYAEIDRMISAYVLINNEDD